MTLRITGVRAGRAPEWDAIWQSCDYATYFHSREWAEMWASVVHAHAPDAKMVTFSDGKKALIPLLSTKLMKGLSHKNYSSYCGTYGGPIAGETMSDAHGSLLAEFMTTKLGELHWRMNPFDEHMRRPGEGRPLYDMTAVLRMGGDFDALYKGFAHQNRTNVRQALSKGVTVRLADSLEDWKAYFAVYQEALKRWDGKATSNYPWSIFEEMHRRKSGHIKLWLAEHEGRIIAGNLFFYSRKIVTAWHGAVLKAYFNFRPVNLLWYNAIKDACERGYTWFDFGPCGGHEGVLRFKETFGVKMIHCPMVNAVSPWTQLIHKVPRPWKKTA